MGANLFRKLVAVDFVGPLSTDEIKEAITKKGYPATLESVDPIMEKESFAYLDIRQKGAGFGGGCCSGGKGPASQGQPSRSVEPQSVKPQSQESLSGITGGGSCCTLPKASQLPPVTIN